MVQERRRAVRRAKASGLLGNHQRCWLWGRNVVLETLRTGRWRPVEVYAADALSPEIRDEVRLLTHDLEIELQTITHDRLSELCHSRDHQGLAAKMPPFPYRELSEFLQPHATLTRFLVLDGMQDPFNFGAVCRAACVFGIDAVIIGSDSQVEVSSHVARSSAGAINRLPIVRVPDLAATLTQLKGAGITLVAATLTASQTIQHFDFRRPVAIVIGNEGTGIRPQILDRCDVELMIPQATDFNSLNAAVATGILLYELHRQRSE